MPDPRPALMALVAWVNVLGVTAFFAPSLVFITLISFFQNVSFTFVSRGRNSGSLAYHAVAALFSNGLYAALLFMSVDVVSRAKAAPAAFVLAYAMSCLSGSVFAHWLALRLERGKGATRS